MREGPTARDAPLVLDREIRAASMSWVSTPMISKEASPLASSR
jgi:hypothetical protein